MVQLRESGKGKERLDILQEIKDGLERVLNVQNGIGRRLLARNGGGIRTVGRPGHAQEHHISPDAGFLAIGRRPYRPVPDG